MFIIYIILFLYKKKGLYILNLNLIMSLNCLLMLILMFNSYNMIKILIFVITAFITIESYSYI